jgi:predicted nucleotidyltransferase
VTDFGGLLAALAGAGVRFIIIGGAAATVHGSARLTQDLDVVYERSRDNMQRLVNALAPHHPYLRGVPPGLPFLWDTETLRRGLNFTLTTDLGDIDLLGEVPGGTYPDLAGHCMDLTVFGTSCQCVDLEWLIVLKRAAGRPKDLEALAELEGLLAERSLAERSKE